MVSAKTSLNNNVHFVVNFRQGQVAVDRGEVYGAVQALYLCEQPPVVWLSYVVLNVGFCLRNQYVFNQGGKLAIVGKLAATVVGFRRFGEHFNDQGGVQ